jgi:hypothetical protein
LSGHAVLLLAAQLGAAASDSPIAPGLGCGSSEGQIIVCGSRGQRSRYRLPEVSTDYETPAARAETLLAPGVQGSIDLQSVELPGGLKSNRLMVTIKTKR